MNELKAILLLNGFAVTMLTAGAMQAQKLERDFYVLQENWGFILYDEKGNMSMKSTPADAAREIMIGKAAAVAA